ALPGLRGAADALAWLSASTVVAVDAAGTTIAGILMFTDVTDTARGRAATDRVLASYRDLAGNVTDFVLRTTLDGTIEWASPSVTAATGWPMTTLIGHAPGGFEHPDDTAKSRALLQGIQQGQRTQGRCRILCADGGYRWFLLSSSPLLAQNGTITGGVHGFTSINALVEAEEAADAERALLRASLDSLADPYVVVASQPGAHGTGTDYIVTEANPAACAFLEIPREQLLGRSLFAPWPVAIAEHLAALCAQVVESALPQRLDGVHSTASGQDRWYDVRVSPVGSGASVHLRDVTSQHLANRAERESHQRYRLLAENASDVVVMVDPHDRIVWVSPSAHDLLGWRPDEIESQQPTELVHPDDLTQVLSARNDFLDGLRLVAPFRLRRKDGQHRWVSASIREVHDADTGLVARVVSVRDVHEETLARQALEASEKMFRAVLTSSSTGMILCDPAGRIEVVNEALCRIMQRDEAWLLSRHTDDLVHPDDLPDVQDARTRSLAAGVTPPIVEMRLIRADGTAIWARRSTSVVRDSAGAPARLIVQLEDVTAEHDAREELRFQAFNDRLTGMPNRAWILNALETDITEARRTLGVVGVLFIDLDNFKLINDSLGHVAGDEVLTEIAERMMAAMRPQDRVGRFGGDEFVVVVPHVTNPDEVERVAATIAETLGTELTIHGHRIVPTVSIGIALSTPESTAASLLRDTDSALFRAKKSGRARWQFFDATMHSQAMNRLTLEDEIRTSLSAGDFVVHYQPVVTLSDRAVVGHEALVRWQHPQRGLVSPAEFLPVAEESGLILGIGRAVLDQVCTVLAEHPDAPGTISVNVSAVELAHDDWAELFTATVKRHGVNPARLVVEVTETAVLALGT
ncbi:MAG: PAS domain S-box protein, partial [Cryobacterium sp.]